MHPLKHKANELSVVARKRFDLNLIESVNIYKAFLLEEISCIKRPMRGSISGIFLKADKTTVILINSSKSLGHQNFTAAHELYHCLFEPELEGRVCFTGNFNNKDEQELLADYFASLFLMPEQGIWHYLYKRVKDVHKIQMSDIIYLEQLYGVSHKAMLIKLRQLGIISENQLAGFSENIIQSAKVYGYDQTLYLPTNEESIISDFAEKARKALDNDLITFSRYEELLYNAGLEHILSPEVQDFVD